ncbi:MAG: AAA family ATPase [Elusimicrobia bacterium]|nr:AAA family ATPase [Elusimicrobiota bacterium]
MTPSMRAAATRFLAAAVSLSIFLPSPALAANLNETSAGIKIAQPVFNIAQPGVMHLGTITIPMEPAPSAFNNAGTLVQIDPAAQAVPAQGADAPGRQALVSRPVIEILNQMQAKGITMPTTLSGQQDAAQWIAAAEVLPEGTAKQNILNMAAAVAAGPAGNGMGPALEKTYDGGDAAGPAAAATVWERLSGSKLIPNFLRKRLNGKASPPASKTTLMDVESLAVPVDKARYTPDLNQLPDSTRKVELSGVDIVGQDKALKSIRAGLEMAGPYYNLYISGADGSGRETALRAILAEIAPKMPSSPDLVAATNFNDPEKTIFLKLNPGSAARLAGAVKEFVRTYQAAFPQALNSDQAKELKRGVNAELAKSAAERQAKFEAEVSQQRVGKFGIKIRPEDAGDGEHFNFGVALTYSEASPELKARLDAVRAEIAAVKVKGFGISIDEAGNVALTHEVDGKAVPMTPEVMAEKQAAGELTEEVLTELVKAATPLAQKFGAIRKELVMKTAASEEELAELVKKGVFTMEEWNAALGAAKAAAEPYMDDFRAMVSENRAEKMVAYQKMYQEIAGMLVSQIGRKVAASVMPNRHDTLEHRAWEKSAAQRQQAVLAEIAAVKVRGYGILIDERSLQTGSIGISHEVDGKMVPMTPEELAAAQQSGALSQDLIKDVIKAATPLIKKFGVLSQELDKEHKALHANDPAPTDEEKKAMGYAQALLKHAVADFESFLPGARDEGTIGRQDPLDHYRINLLRASNGAKGWRVVFEDKPTLEKLFGLVEPNRDTRIINGVALKTLSPGGPTIKTGSILEADVIVMNVMDLLRQPGAWHAVMELVRTGQAEIPEVQGMFGFAAMTGNYHVAHRPKIVLIGSPYIKMLLLHYEEDFQRGFNAAAEFVHELDINPDTVSAYVQFMKKMAVKGAGLVMDFNRDAMGAVLEYASSEAESNEKFTAQFGSIYNLMREASRVAKNAGRKDVRREDVQTALDDRKDSTSQRQKRYMELLEKRTFVINTKGMKYNEVNGLVVMGDFGAPARVTFVESQSSKGGGVVSNDQAAKSTGHSMDKAFANVQGYFEKTYGKLVENILKRYSFEQTYGGLDGDSATGVKISLGELSMAGLALRQDGAMTGSDDQLGENVQAIGGVNYKIEGLFDLLNHNGQLVVKENIRERAFVIIPRSNVSQLTLKPEIIQAIREKRFVIFAVDNVRQAQEIFSYVPYAEINRRVKAYARHERGVELAKEALEKKYAGDTEKLLGELEKLDQADQQWRAQMKAEGEAYRTAALAPKN